MRVPIRRLAPWTLSAVLIMLGCSSDSHRDPVSPQLDLADASSGAAAHGHANVTQAPGVLRTFSFTAREMPDGTVKGEFVNHNRLQDFVNHGDIDCLQVEGNVAILSGTIRKHTNPAMEGWRTIFRVVDNGEGANDLPDEVSVLANRPPTTTLDCRTFPPEQFIMVPVEDGNIQVDPGLEE